jgi:DMSO/TMAO reductase YedYZ molybdopterin-dependent catalytic subunit
MMTRPRTERLKPAVTEDEIRPDLMRIGRRSALKRGLSLGGLALLTGCDLSTHSGLDAALWAMMRFDDRVQAALFSRRRLARTYPVSAVTNPFRFNAYYEEWQVRDAPEDWRLDVSGLVADKAPWTLEKLRSLPNEA